MGPYDDYHRHIWQLAYWTPIWHWKILPSIKGAGNGSEVGRRLTFYCQGCLELEIVEDRNVQPDQ